MSFPNVVLPSGPMAYADIGTQLESAVVSWKDLAWIRQVWGGRLMDKGVLTADPALAGWFEAAGLALGDYPSLRR